MIWFESPTNPTM